MTIKVKNISLKNKVFKKINELHKRSVKALERGDLRTSNKLERLSDNLYKKNYAKMFNVVKTKTGWKIKNA